MAGQPGASTRAAQKFIVFENFEKMNTAALREGLPEKELAWQENLQAIAGNRLVTVPHEAATALATIGATALSQFDATLSGTDYIITFTTNGAAYAINQATGVVNNFAPPGTFASPDMTVWQNERLLINDTRNGYSTWDGTTFISPGNVSPVIVLTNGGSGYSTAPSVTISGGSGTGATAHSVIQDGFVVSVILDNPGHGYSPGDVLTVTFGTGVGSGATGHVTMTGFNVSDITITNPGGFALPTPGTYPLVFAGGGGTGAAGTATVTPIGTGGFQVSSVSLTNGGSGYTTAPGVSLAASGVNPTFQAFLGTEAVATIVLDTGGSAYVAPPTVTLQGGNPAVAATAHATISAGAVNALVLDTPGSGYTSTPMVVIGSGSGAAATAIVWPFAAKGTNTATIAVFGGRVWLGGDLLLQYTGVQGFDDFNSANAAGSLIITDPDLVHAITALRAANNYLFIMGDESVKQIGNISLSADGSTTLFTILTLSSDQGTIYPLSCGSFNRVFTFANKNGVYAVLGSSVQKISTDVDGIWADVDFSLQPQQALIDLNGIHNIGYLIKYPDPFTQTTRSIILVFDGKRWWVIFQGASLRTIVATSTLASGTHQLFGSSGTDIRQLLSDPDTDVSFRLQTALSHHGNAIQGKKVIRSGFAYQLETGTDALTHRTESEDQMQFAARTLNAGFHVAGYGDAAVEVSGVYLGITLNGLIRGLTISTLAIEMQENSLWPNK